MYVLEHHIIFFLKENVAFYIYFYYRLTSECGIYWNVDKDSWFCLDLTIDTVVMNPPFGTRKKGADMDFLAVALKVQSCINYMYFARAVFKCVSYYIASFTYSYFSEKSMYQVASRAVYSLHKTTTRDVSLPFLSRLSYILLSNICYYTCFIRRSVLFFIELVLCEPVSLWNWFATNILHLIPLNETTNTIQK